jgi:DNA polymerase
MPTAATKSIQIVVNGQVRKVPAAQSLLGRNFSVSRQRGQLVESSLAPYATATVHPSSILRATDDESRHQQMQAFVNDLKTVARLVRRNPAA